MERYRLSLGRPLTWLRPLALAVGTFDGVHVGHQRLIRRLVREARQEGLPAAVLTFEPHPQEILSSGRTPQRLTLLEEKASLVASLGADIFLVMTFDSTLAAMSPDQFAERVLRGMLRARRLHVGYNFSFGAGASGNAEYLQRWGQERGIGVRIHPRVTLGGATVSSTCIREALARGAVGAARLMLGRPYHLEGEVVAGEGRGRQLGYPTANLRWSPEKVVPAPGVYAVWVAREEGGGWPGVANFGYRPTFGGKYPSLEVHLLEGGGDLYGARLRLSFWRRLRGEKRFPNAQALARQLERDARRARGLLEVYTGSVVCYNRRG